MASSYTASDIEVLSGLDPVRRRPGMYTDTTRPNHLAHEVIDNSVDEAIDGYCDNINVTLHKDGSLRGRGQRPRHAGRHPSEGEDQRRRVDSHAPARRRKIQRQELSACRRPARRRRVGGQRPVQEPRSVGAPRRQGIQPELRRRQTQIETRGGRRCAEVQDRHHHPLLAGSEILRFRQVCHPEAQAGAARQGGAVPEPARHAQQRAHRREGRVVLHRRPAPIPRRGARQGRVAAGGDLLRQARHRGRRPGMGVRLGAGVRASGHRKLRQSDSHHRGRHARQRSAHRRLRCGARVLRVPQPGAARPEADARRMCGTA